MIDVKTFTFNEFSENTYVLYDESKDCLIIDPGCNKANEEKELDDFIASKGLKPTRLLNTHCHVDHVFGNWHVSKKYNLGLEIHEVELPVLNSAGEVARMYGLNMAEQPEPTAFLKEGDKIELGKHTLDILFCPGHAPGHVVFLSHEQQFIIGGDVLFQGSIGRTDLPGGNHDTLINSIKTKLLPLKDSFQVYSGHGPSTNIGFERSNNPFLQN